MTVNGTDMKIEDIMRPAKIVEENLDFRAAVKKMIEEKTNSLVVVDAEGKCVGLVNPRGLLKQVVPDYLESDQVSAHFATESIFREEVSKVADVSISDFMLADVVTVNKEDTIMQVAVKAISSGHVRLPVVDADDKVVGIITRTELKNLIGAFLDLDGCFQK